MSVYKRGGIYQYDFRFKGKRFKASTRTRNRTAALTIQVQKRAELAEGRTPLKKCPSFTFFVEEEFLP